MKKHFLLIVLTISLFFYTGCNKNSEKIQSRISADEITKTEYVQNKTIQINDKNTNDLAKKILTNKEVEKVIIIKTSSNILVGTRLKKQNAIPDIYTFKEEIKQEVINQYGNTRDITVITTDPVFQRLEKLATDIRNNRPITGFFEDITDMVNSMIPTI